MVAGIIRRQRTDSDDYDDDARSDKLLYSETVGYDLPANLQLYNGLSCRRRCWLRPLAVSRPSNSGVRPAAGMRMASSCQTRGAARRGLAICWPSGRPAGSYLRLGDEKGVFGGRREGSSRQAVVGMPWMKATAAAVAAAAEANGSCRCQLRCCRLVKLLSGVSDVYATMRERILGLSVNALCILQYNTCLMLPILLTTHSQPQRKPSLFAMKPRRCRNE